MVVVAAACRAAAAFDMPACSNSFSRFDNSAGDMRGTPSKSGRLCPDGDQRPDLKAFWAPGWYGLPIPETALPYPVYERSALDTRPTRWLARQPCL